MSYSSVHKTTALSICILLSTGATFAADLTHTKTKSNVTLPATNSAFSTQNIREILQHQQAQQAADDIQNELARSKTHVVLAETDNKHCPKLSDADLQQVIIDANYILSSQYLNPTDPAHGAINNVNITGASNAKPDWVVPRENGLAILALVQAYENTGNKEYLKRAQLAADYLVRIQDTDGGWFDQYNYAEPSVKSKSPTQTAEVMMALGKLGFSKARYAAMKKGAQFLMSLQDVANKGGLDDGLIGGGKKEDGSYHTWRWTSDNSFAWLALKDTQKWALMRGDLKFAREAGQSAHRILEGINTSLYVDDPSDPDYGVWRRAIDENGNAIDPTYHEWINYAPQMLDLPAVGVGKQIVGEWIHKTFQKEDGSVVWDDRWFSDRKSPGYSFQASLVWLDLGQTQYAAAAKNWALNSGLKQLTPDPNGVAGNWVDWSQNGSTAPWWERFIDTSFYWISVVNGGYNFRS